MFEDASPGGCDDATGTDPAPDDSPEPPPQGRPGASRTQPPEPDDDGAVWANNWPGDWPGEGDLDHGHEEHLNDVRRGPSPEEDEDAGDGAGGERADDTADDTADGGAT